MWYSTIDVTEQCSSQREKTRNKHTYLQHTLRQARPRLNESSGKGTFIYEAVSWMLLVHQMCSRTRCTDSIYPLIVLVEPTHYRNSNYLAPYIMRGMRRSARYRKLLSNHLMQSCLVEVRPILIENALELLHVVVQAFLSRTKKRSQIA